MRNYKKFVEGLEKEPNIKCKFKLGDKVTFTNQYGVEFKDKTIIGFSHDGDLHKYGNHIHIDTDAYWFPHKEEELILKANE